MSSHEDIVMKEDIKLITEKIDEVNLQVNNNFLYQEYRKTLNNIEKSLVLKDTKTLFQNFRQINRFRKGFSDDDLSFICDIFLRNNFSFQFIPACEPSMKEGLITKFGISNKLGVKVKEVPEFIVFNSLIVLTILVDKKNFNDCMSILQFLLDYLKRHESNTIQYLKAKVYYYYSYISEKLGKSESTLHGLNSAYRKACLELDEVTQITLINCIVRYYINNNAYEQARSFLSKTKFHENIMTSEDARYLYYLGRINAVQLNYSEAYINLTNSLRKSPEKCGKGFKIIIQKLLIIIEMLMGEIPDMTKYSEILREIKPYFELTKAVKQGNLGDFSKVLTEYEKIFIHDKNYNLVQRLRHVVIKVGLRKINISYNRISLTDITQKLHLESELETEYIIAKAIQDGVFLAKINKDEGNVQSLEMKDVYSTFEPQKVLQRRILFLNKIYNDTMKGLKYTESNTNKKNKDTEKDLDEDFGTDDRFVDF